MDSLIRLDQVGMSQKTPKLLCHGMGKDLMTSQGPVAPSTIPLLLRHKQHAIEMVQSIIKDADLDKCSEHETKSLGEVGLFNLRKFYVVPSIYASSLTHRRALHTVGPAREDYNKGKSQKWEIGGDFWDEPFGGPRLLEIAFLSLDELELEVMLVENDEENVEEEDVVVI
ncbi:hypothetical protein SO802_005349 [Lithocarpus litseifolius]|uniref:Uncharacterized protein n=1 Tax=Lithocarpus litseifolius TaxID=425828 RepID=A0AAW2DIL6_9ROSI